MVNRDNQAKTKEPPDAAPAMIERPKMSMAMWSAMKMHIMKQREKKKQEQEADAAIERLRREQEIKRKQDAMTLEEIKDQLSRFERKLSDLKEEKHQLFSQLKKVLNEDETRRRAQVKEASEMVAVSHGYVPHGMSLGVQPLYMPAQGQHILNRAPILYKGVPPQQNLIPPGAMKRPRSPSPPPQHTTYHQNFNFKTHMPAFNQKAGVYSTNQFYTHPSQGVQMTVSPVVNSSSSSSLPPGAPPPTTATTYPSFPNQFGPSEQAPPSKHLAHSGYHLSHIQQQNFVNSLQQLEQVKQENRFSEEKYYVPAGTVVPIRGQSMIQIQQPSTKGSGSIITGYPVRAQASAPQHFQPAPPTSGPPPQSHPHGSFVPQPGVSRLQYPGQPNQRYY